MKTKQTGCNCNAIHPEIIEKAAKSMPQNDDITELAAFFKICGDPTRMKILFALFSTEMCVCDISSLLNMTVSSISHQLRILKQARMVTARKEGQNVYYSASDEHVEKIMNQGMDHLTE
ncbi:MAG: helix-turn-helix transcriptional regulator [bacterium]|nr:helix-turn-helix transcriptional regulator [bacterium]